MTAEKIYSGHEPSKDEIIVHRSKFGEKNSDLVKDRRGDHPDLPSVDEMYRMYRAGMHFDRGFEEKK